MKVAASGESAAIATVQSANSTFASTSGPPSEYEFNSYSKINHLRCSTVVLLWMVFARRPKSPVLPPKRPIVDCVPFWTCR